MTGRCTASTGSSNCPVGKTGANCLSGKQVNKFTNKFNNKYLLDCPQGRWGAGCTRRSECRNGALTDTITGKCTCGIGWTGNTCSEGKDIIAKAI